MKLPRDNILHGIAASLGSAAIIAAIAIGMLANINAENVKHNKEQIEKLSETPVRIKALEVELEAIKAQGKQNSEKLDRILEELAEHRGESKDRKR